MLQIPINANPRFDRADFNFAGPATSVETVRALKGTDEFPNPRAWRKKTAAFGLPGLDLPAEDGGSAWPAAKMIEVFKRAGEHNLNFRDVVGGGRVRPLLKSTD